MRLAVIPARLEASRLPGKPLALLGGVPMVVHVWRRVAASGLFDRVLVATDAPAIGEAVRAWGGTWVATGPAPSGTHRVAVAARDSGAQVVVNVQGDLPTVGNDALAAVLRALERAEIATVCAPWVGDPGDRARVKVAVDAAGRALGFSRAPIAGSDLLEHVGIYGFTAGALARAVAAPSSARSVAEDLEQVRWLDAGLAIAVEGIAVAPGGIDLPEQLEALRRRFEAGFERVPPAPDPAVYASDGLR